MNGARQRYLQEVIQQIKSGEDMVIVSSDYAAPILDRFKEEYPERFVSVGIAEQDLIQVACGLAMAGHRAIAYGMSPFPCIRGFDQIRNSAAMMNLPIQIASVGTGFNVTEYGASHYNAEDMSIMRTIPNMEVVTVSDEWIAAACAQRALCNQTPMYVRFDKSCDGQIYDDSNPPEWERGFAVAAETGKNGLAVVTNSYYVGRLINIAKTLWDEERIPLTVIDLFRQPFDQKALLDILNGCIGVVTIEEHILRGGIGTEVLELKERFSSSFRLERIGIDFGGQYPETYGSREYFLDQYGLSDQALTKKLSVFYKKLLADQPIL